jgi:hypoxia up-regulated 1
MRQLLGAVLAVCATAQISYAKKLSGSTVLGIDLGGNFMKAAYVAPGEEDPFPILLSDLSERRSAYAVAFRKGKWLFGTHATKAAISNPESTFTYIGSHLLGRQWNSPEVEYYRSIFVPRLEADPSRGTVMALDAEEKIVPVEFLAGIYLENIKEHSEFVSNRRFSGAVITTPSYYDQLQRRALLEAAEIAGVNVYALINPASAGTLPLQSCILTWVFSCHILRNSSV